MVKDRYQRALKKLWQDQCSIMVTSKKVDEMTGQNILEDVVLLENEPCRLSFSAVPPAGVPSPAAPLEQSVKLFLSPVYPIPPGSRIQVQRDGKIFEYQSSGLPAVYESHQEVPLRQSKGWA